MACAVSSVQAVPEEPVERVEQVERAEQVDQAAMPAYADPLEATCRLPGNAGRKRIFPYHNNDREDTVSVPYHPSLRKNTPNCL